MSREQAQDLLYEIQLLDEKKAEATRLEAVIRHHLKEAESTIESIKELEKETGEDTLVPLGADVYVKSKISSNSTVLVSIGANVVLEKDNQFALNFLEERIKGLQINLQEIISNKNIMEDKIQQLKIHASQAMYASSQKPTS